MKKEFIIGTIMLVSILLAVFYSYPFPLETSEVTTISFEERINNPHVNHTYNENVIYFGFDIRLNPRTEIEIYAPLMEYLSSKLGKEFRIKFASSYEEVQDDLGKGVTQFAIVGPVSYVMVNMKYGNAVPVVVGLDENRSPYYRAVIFTRPESDINSLEDLHGRSFAFGSFYSTQGHLIPRIMLEKAGIILKDLKGYAFLGSHQACAQAVISGRFDAGGMQDTLAHRLAKRGLIKIIAVSELFPRSLIAANAGVDSDLIKSVRDALLELDPLGKDSKLTKWYMTEFSGGFAPITDDYYQAYYFLVKKYLLESE